MCGFPYRFYFATLLKFPIKFNLSCFCHFNFLQFTLLRCINCWSKYSKFMWCSSTIVDLQGLNYYSHSSSHHYLPLFILNNPLKELFIKSMPMGYWSPLCALVFVQYGPLKVYILGEGLIKPWKFPYLQITSSTFKILRDSIL